MLRLRMTRARAVRVALALIGLLCAGYSIWWWVAATAVERGVLAWIEERRAEGALVEHRGLSVGGFPLALRASVEAPHFASRGVEWQGPGLVAEALPWQVTRVTLSLPGEHRLILAPAGQPPVDLLARAGGNGHANWTPGGTVEQVRLSFVDLVAQQASTPIRLATLDVTASQPAEPPAGPTVTGLSLDLTAAGLTLPEASPAALGRQVERATLTARVLGIPPRPEPASLSAWSRQGGTVEVDRLSLHWGPLRVALAGTLALDGELQPQAALTAEVIGAQDAISAVQPLLRPNEVKMARSVVTMLARPTGPGGEQVITAPVTVQSSNLFLGPLKVASMPRIVW